MPALKLIAGLGNPGKQYEMTRHNLGFMVILELAERYKISLRASRFTKAHCGHGEIEGHDVLFVLPTTFMNNSGVAVKRLAYMKEVEVENILVICDDLNLDFGRIRIRGKGSAGGHNGLKSINKLLDTQDYSRLRMGISQAGSQEIKDYVLAEFPKKERDLLNEFVERAADGCVAWISEGISKAMERYNKST